MGSVADPPLIDALRTDAPPVEPPPLAREPFADLPEAGVRRELVRGGARVTSPPHGSAAALPEFRCLVAELFGGLAPSTR